MPGVVCTTCMNARDPDLCREAWQPCVLGAPVWEEFLATRGEHMAPEEELFKIFNRANKTYARGLRHRVAGGEACEHGHTDYLHADLSNVSDCRPHYQGDTCSNPTPAPFICTCVSKMVAYERQDTMGEDARFYFVMIGLGCSAIAIFMFLLKILDALREYLRRRLSKGGLRVRVPTDEPVVEEFALSDGHTLEFLASMEEDPDHALKEMRELQKRKEELDMQLAVRISEELRELWHCVCCTTFCIAAIGGPCCLLLSIPNPETAEYWVGCGFRIPLVIIYVNGIDDPLARPEFAHQAPGANAAG